MGRLKVVPFQRFFRRVKLFSVFGNTGLKVNYPWNDVFQITIVTIFFCIYAMLFLIGSFDHGERLIQLDI